MTKRLMVFNGADQGRYFPLGETGTMIVGASRKHADIHLNDIYVSRVHCYVELEDGKVVVVDAEDSNGTMVNGQKVQRQEMNMGDVLRVGNTHFRLEDDGAGPAAAAAAAPAAASDNDAPLAFSDAPSGGAPSAVAAPPAAPASAPHAAAPTSKPLEELANHQLAHFQLGAMVGKGYFGAVFRARDVKSDREVALRVLSPEFPKSDEEMQRFVQAMKLMPPLRHPNLVTVLGVGKSGPFCWIAMEYVEGENLESLVQHFKAANKLDWQPAFRLAMHLGRALHFAHQHHFIHRNITPFNVLFRTTDHLFKLGDLIQSRAFLGSQLKQRTLRPKSQHEMPYLSPEQTRPQGVVDARSDIYCLGVMVYYLLTAQLPLSAPTPAELIELIREAEPVMPQEYLPSVPEKFELIVLKMLAKNPDDRYQSAAELLTALHEISLDPA